MPPRLVRRGLEPQTSQNVMSTDVHIAMTPSVMYAIQVWVNVAVVAQTISMVPAAIMAAHLIVTRVQPHIQTVMPGHLAILAHSTHMKINVLI